MAAGIAFFSIGGAADAQTLEQQYQSLISNNCANLGTTNPGGGTTSLDALCGGGIIVFTGLDAQSAFAVIAQDAIPSAGGGGSSQASGIALTQERIRVRREQARPRGQQGSEALQYASAVDTNIAQSILDTESLSIFYSGDYEARDKDSTTFEDGYEADIAAASLGGDMLLGRSGVAGLVFNYQRINGDFDNGGRFETDSYGVLAYGSYFPTEQTFVELVLGYARKNYDVARLVSFEDAASAIFVLPSPVTSNTNGNEFSTRLQTGYDHSFGRYTVGPRVAIDFVHVEVDGFSETGSTGLELRFDDRSQTSLQSSVGVQASAAFSTSFAVLLPQVSFDWVHEFRNDQQSIDVQFAGDLRATPTAFSFQNEEPDRDFFNLKIGLVAVLRNGWKPYGEFRTLLGHDFFSSIGGSIGLRIEL